MDALKVAAVLYLNAKPLVAQLQQVPGIDLRLVPPSEGARMLAERQADVALVPVAAVAQMGGLEALDMAICADGEVRSVLIVSKRPLEELDTLLLDASSRTSVILAQLELRARNIKVKLRTESPERALDLVDDRVGALIIGDIALRRRGEFPYVLDLAASWRARTGLPFVFAIWAARPGTWNRQVVAMLQGALDWGQEHFDDLSEGDKDARDYLEQCLSYRLTDRHRQGLKEFFRQAADAKLLPSTSLQFWADDAPNLARQESLDALLSRASEGVRLSGADALRLYRDAELFDLGLAADRVRRRHNPSAGGDGAHVTYIVDRNINYTNVCTTSCRFCAFYRPVKHPEGYVLTRAQFTEKLIELKAAGGVQILLQGGLNPALRLTWYEDLFRWIKSEFRIGLHALSPEEIIFLSELESLPVPTILERLRAAGMDSLPGGGAEILVDRVRHEIARAKCTSSQWLSVMRAAHNMAMRSSATMMYGTIDSDEDRIQHLLKLRDLQDETGGFTAFFCWDFQYEHGTRQSTGDHGRLLYLRTQAIARLVLDNFAHIGSSWVTQGPVVGQIALRFGADDWGSVMFEENVVSSAGTTFRMNAESIETYIREAGFTPVRRDVLYRHLG